MSKKNSHKSGDHSHKVKNHHNHNVTHSHSHASSKKSDGLSSITSNYWAVATIILAVVLVVLVVMDYYETDTPAAVMVGEERAGEIVLEFAESQGLEATLKGIEIESGLYKVNVEVQGQDVPVYLTSDGVNLVPSVLPLSELMGSEPQNNDNGGQTPAPQNVPKSDKPKVELFVMSHCPYGTQAEKGMIPAAAELGDDIDFELKFVNYAMHPTQGEVEEQLAQHCIQEEQNDKFFEYLTCFLEEGDGAGCLESTGIDTDSLEECTTRVDEEFAVIANLDDKSSWLNGRFPKFLIHDAENQEYGVRGSPTLVINGEQVSSGRDAQSYLTAICEGFNDKPEACDTDLSELGVPGPGFGFDSQGGSAAAAGCVV